MEEELQRVRALITAIKEENGQCVLTKEEVLAVLDEYSMLLESVEKLLAEWQRVEFLLAEYRLVKLGLKRVHAYIN